MSTLRCVCAFLAALVSLFAAGVTADDLYRVQAVSDPHLSPNGALVAYVLTVADQKANRRNSSVWLVPADGSHPAHALTTLGSSSAPRWSPDGKTLAFVGTRPVPGETPPARPQIFLLSMDGGEPRRVTSLANGVSAYQWSPDGTHFAVISRTAPAGEPAPTSDAKRYFFPTIKADGQGYLDNKRAHLFVVDAATGAAKQLTSGEQENDSDPKWSPDSKRIAYTIDRTDLLDWRNSGLRVIDAQGGTPMPVGDVDTQVHAPAWSPDGKKIAFIGASSEVNIPKIYTASALDRGKAELVSNDVTFVTELDWIEHGRALMFVGAFHGEHPIFRIDAASGAVTRLLAEGTARQFDVDDNAGRVVYVASGPGSPGDIFSAGLAVKSPRKLTGHNDSWLGAREKGNFERISTKAADGLAVESFLIKPIGWQAGKTYPMLLVIHGGPNGMHGPHWVLDWEVFASRGYAVLLTNPRGSSGYGEAYQRGVYQQWGGRAYEDLMASVDNVLTKNAWIDRNRLGVTGLSYGGFMTNWIVGHTTRFNAAVTLSSISNFASVEGTRDGFYGHARDFGGDFFEDFDTYWKTSPLRYAKNVKTPTLILHGEADQRVPQEQAEQWFRALKHFGVESELILFPHESHVLKTEPRHTVEILNLTTDWFDRHLSK